MKISLEIITAPAGTGKGAKLLFPDESDVRDQRPEIRLEI